MLELKRIYKIPSRFCRERRSDEKITYKNRIVYDSKWCKKDASEESIKEQGQKARKYGGFKEYGAV